MEWYHTILIHPGNDHMKDSIFLFYKWKGPRTDIFTVLQNM